MDSFSDPVRRANQNEGLLQGLSRAVARSEAVEPVELGAIGELVGGVAVIATLLYLALQVRQNTLETRVASSQALTDSINQVNLAISVDANRASITRRGREDYSS